MNRQQILTQRHLLECYLFLHDFRIESSSGEHLQLRRKAESRDFHLKIDDEWLGVKSNATVEQRLNALGLVPFLEQNGSARIGVTATGQEVVTHLEPELKP